MPAGQDLGATEQHFTGKQHDPESGLDYFGARYLASSTGRWMSPDWSEEAEPVPYSKMDDPQTLNLYAYVLSNPLSNIDADGHCADIDRDCLINGHNNAAYQASEAQNAGEDPIAAARGVGVYANTSSQARQQSTQQGSSQSTSVSPKGEKAISAAYQVACSHSTDGCSSGQQVNVRYVGFTYNVQIPGDTMDPSTLPADSIKDPGITNKIFHNGAPDSFYLTTPLGMAGANVPHVVDNLRGIEAHIDHFGPANPIHWGEAILSLFINTRAQAGAGFVQTCSPSGGCR
jgi:RHS repeat-associated protein